MTTGEDQQKAAPMGEACPFCPESQPSLSSVSYISSNQLTIPLARNTFGKSQGPTHEGETAVEQLSEAGLLGEGSQASTPGASDGAEPEALVHRAQQGTWPRGLTSGAEDPKMQGPRATARIPLALRPAHRALSEGPHSETPQHGARSGRGFSWGSEGVAPSKPWPGALGSRWGRETEQVHRAVTPQAHAPPGSLAPRRETLC